MSDAAVEAGVKKFVPAEWGINLVNERRVELLPLMRERRDVVGVV